MSAPQLTDANTSSEWFRAVAEPGVTEKPRLPSQASIPADLRRKRFVRLVTYTMGGLVAFTLLGVASFSMRQKSMQSALIAPPEPPAGLVPVTAAPATPEAVAAVGTSPEPVSDVHKQPEASRPHAVAPAHVAVKSASLAKPSKRPATRSPFLAKR